jgi:hypothetical protein
MLAGIAAPPFPADWRLQVVLRYRVARKRALELALGKLAAHLGLPSPAAGAAEGQLEAAELPAEHATTSETSAVPAAAEL